MGTALSANFQESLPHSILPSAKCLSLVVMVDAKAGALPVCKAAEAGGLGPVVGGG